MDKQILQLALSRLELQRRENEQESARRMEEIRLSQPTVWQLVEKRQGVIASALRSPALSAEGDPVKLMEDYNRRISAALVKADYPSHYLLPVCQCPECEDTGYVYRGNKKEYCACLLRQYEALARQEGGTDAMSFSAFDPLRFPESLLPGTDVSQREYMLLVKDKCVSFAKQLQTGPVRNLLLHGGSGLGKTYLLRCIEREAVAMGIPCLFITAYDLLDALRNQFFGRENDTADLCMEVQLLLVDDLGMEPLMENITVEQIYHLINSRLSRGLNTALSTNLSRTELQKRYTERFTSRLLDVRNSLAIPFLGEDIRLKR